MRLPAAGRARRAGRQLPALTCLLGFRNSFRRPVRGTKRFRDDLLRPAAVLPFMLLGA